MTVHQATLCHWPYFRGALLGDFKEAETQCIELPEDRPETVQAFLEFVYSGNYVYRSPNDKSALKCNKGTNMSGGICLCRVFVMCGTPAMKSTKPNFDECLVCEHTIHDHRRFGNVAPASPPAEQALEKMEFHARVYFLADRFGVSKLQKLAADRIYESEGVPYVGKNINDLKVAKLIYLNTSPTDKFLRKMALEKTVNLLLAINSTTNSTPQVEKEPAKSTSSGGLFGTPNPTPTPPARGLFATAASTSGFGAATQPPPSTGLFGSINNPPPPPPTSYPGLFGGGTSHSSSGSLFGSSAARPPVSPSPPPQSAFSLFGSSPAVPSGKSQSVSPVVLDSEVNDLLEELATQDPSFAVDIIKSMAKMGSRG